MRACHNCYADIYKGDRFVDEDPTDNRGRRLWCWACREEKHPEGPRCRYTPSVSVRPTAATPPEWFNMDPVYGDLVWDFARKVHDHLAFIYRRLGIEPDRPLPERDIREPDAKWARATAHHVERIEERFAATED